MSEEEALGFETVLIMQGGGSLGAYECGVVKTLCKHKIEFDVVAGTSIGAVNAAILAGSRESNAAKTLEDFWLTLAERITPSFLPEEFRRVVSSTWAGLYGNSKAFAPKWFSPSADYFLPHKWPYFYDISPLKQTLSGYVDFSKIRSDSKPRLIVTSTDVRKGEAVTFDSKNTKIDADHILASAGYPFYGIKWTQKNGRYLWDGSLLSNTPLREVIDASPRCDKRVYIISLFPRVHNELPDNMSEAWHRARDIMHSDKTEHNVRMSRVITRYLELLNDMHDLLNNANLDEKGRAEFKKLEPEYHKLAEQRGAIIEDIIRIERREDSHFLFEDADFSIATIQKLIKEGEEEAEAVLSKRG